MVITIHINAALNHQVEHALWFKAGLKRHGVDLVITSNIQQESDIHIVSGPHYAASYWASHKRTILLDRCYYMGNPDNVSLGWIKPNGGRQFIAGSGRKSPDIKPNRARSGRIFLADYNGPVETADTVRLHPGRSCGQPGLIDELRRHRVAIGYRTTALVTAALEGLEIECKDDRNILAEPNWLELLPYADWHKTEIESGEAWQHLLQSLRQL